MAAGAPMSRFRKEKDCPSSLELAESVAVDLDGLVGLGLANHIGRCDFCAAELEFYRHYPPEPVLVSTPPIPKPLFELAESILTRETIHISRLELLLGNFG
jgi:hypothetical protein